MIEYNIEEIISNLDFEKNKLRKTKNNIQLTIYEIQILKKYHIAYDKCKTAKEILQQIEYKITSLEESEQEELDEISVTIAERDYYKNTRK